MASRKLWLMALLSLAAVSCTSKPSFLSFLFSKEEEALPKLDQQQLLEELKYLDMTLTSMEGVGAGAAVSSYFLCEAEKRLSQDVRVRDGVLTAKAEVDASACDAGLGSFTFTLACPGEPDQKLPEAPAHGFFHRSGFNFTGVWEEKCLALGKGSAAFSVVATMTAGKERTQFSVRRKDEAPCTVGKEDDGGTAIFRIKDCEYRTRIDGKRTLDRRAEAEELKGRAGDRYYSSGAMLLTVNDWKGTVRFSNGSKTPVAELSNGKDTMTVNLGGPFTEGVKP